MKKNKNNAWNGSRLHLAVVRDLVVLTMTIKAHTQYVKVVFNHYIN